MNRPTELLLNLFRYKVYPVVSRKKMEPTISYINDRIKVREMIKELLLSDTPCMIARYGAYEVNTAINYVDIKEGERSVVKYIKGECGAWWWRPGNLEQLKTNAGFFPLREKYLEKYAQLLIEDTAYLDLLGVTPITGKAPVFKEKCPRVRLGYLEPDYFTENASEEWTACLKGKKVMVVHPFSSTIESQYKKRSMLFPDKQFLPDFELYTVKAVQSLGGDSDFNSWFDALSYMEKEMDKVDYDIAIIGCGAYGFHLAAHAKRKGHKAIHLGGATQILFGVKGKRWEERDDFKVLFNDNWCRPREEDRPKGADKVEKGCYW